MKVIRNICISILTFLLFLTVCAAQNVLPFEDSVEVIYSRYGRKMTETVFFRTNIADNMDAKSISLPVQFETDAEIFLYVNDEAVTYTDNCTLRLKLGENRIRVVIRSKNGIAEKSYLVNANIHIPEGPSHDALAFCVEQGILSGNENLDLQPEKTATRAEFAAMLTRLLQLDKQADLSAFCDIAPSAWYHSPMSAAVGSGLMAGTSENTLSPNAPLTREQAFVILSRAFGLDGSDPTAAMSVSDAKSISPWAIGGVSAMINGEYVDGSGSQLRPKDPITREELAQIFYKMIDAVAASPNEIPQSGTVVYVGSQVPTNISLNGNLILPNITASEIDLTSLQVTGNVTVYSHGASIRWDGSVGTLTVCGTANLRPENAISLRLPNSGSAILGGSVETVQAQAGIAVIDTTVGDLSLHGGNLRLDSGHVKKLTVKDSTSKVLGGGTIQTAVFYAKPAALVPSVADLQMLYDAGLEGVTLSQTETPTANPTQQTVTVSATVSGVNSEAVYGVDDGIRKCKATFTYNGTVLSTQDILLKDGAKLSCSVSVPTAAGSPKSQTVLLQLQYGHETVKTTLNIIVEPAPDIDPYLKEAKTIQTINVEATVLRDLTVYTTSGMSKSTGVTIKKGEIVTFIRNHGSSYRIKTANGTVGYASAWGLQISNKAYYSDHQYSVGAREAFVNKLHDYSSSTKYLLWLNLYTETVTVFEGSQGNWKYLKECRSSSGKNTTPTRVGVFRIYSRSYKWTFDDNYYYVKHPSLFDGGIAFHSRTYLTNGGGFLDSRLGMTISHGCVRVPDDMAEWIFHNCAPGGTTVVVY